MRFLSSGAKNYYYYCQKLLENGEWVFESVFAIAQEGLRSLFAALFLFPNDCRRSVAAGVRNFEIRYSCFKNRIQIISSVKRHPDILIAPFFSPASLESAAARGSESFARSWGLVK